MTESTDAVLVTAKLASDLQELTFNMPDLSPAAVRFHFSFTIEHILAPARCLGSVAKNGPRFKCQVVSFG